MAAAFVAAKFNNIMDFLQLIFAFVNAPLFATFLLGMFWKRATGNAAFVGLLAGTTGAALHHGLTQPAGATTLIKGGWLHLVHVYPSEMAQNFWTAIVAFGFCFVVTVALSILTKSNKSDEELKGLVYSLTPRIKEDKSVAWYASPATLGVIVCAVAVVLNIIFW
jgi:SSS family solute:Na+ symporter